MPKSYRFVIKGRVQGVFFRQSTREQAEGLGLQGWVTNREDGTVEGRVHGEDADRLETFRQWLHRGPKQAQVQEVHWSESQDFMPANVGFEVRR